jgi:hypothetical protein
MMSMSNGVNVGVLRGRKEGLLFLKKEAKNFYSCALARDPTRLKQHAPKGLKVFWFFFSKKNTFFLSSAGTCPLLGPGRPGVKGARLASRAAKPYENALNQDFG